MTRPMRRRTRTPAAAFGAAFAALLVATAGCEPNRETPGGESPGGIDGRVEVGLPAPAYATVSLDGDSVSLAQQKGKVVLLNIWATWCHPCRDEIPELIAIHGR